MCRQEGFSPVCQGLHQHLVEHVIHEPLEERHGDGCSLQVVSGMLLKQTAASAPAAPSCSCCSKLLLLPRRLMLVRVQQWPRAPGKALETWSPALHKRQSKPGAWRLCINGEMTWVGCHHNSNTSAGAARRAAKVQHAAAAAGGHSTFTYLLEKRLSLV